MEERNEKLPGLIFTLSLKHYFKHRLNIDKNSTRLGYHHRIAISSATIKLNPIDSAMQRHLRTLYAFNGVSLVHHECICAHIRRPREQNVSVFQSFKIVCKKHRIYLRPIARVRQMSENLTTMLFHIARSDHHERSTFVGHDTLWLQGCVWMCLCVSV